VVEPGRIGLATSHVVHRKPVSVVARRIKAPVGENGIATFVGEAIDEKLKRSERVNKKF
jgi:hypothetical protein